MFRLSVVRSLRHSGAVATAANVHQGKMPNTLNASRS
jgi:hypothetical protein